MSGNSIPSLINGSAGRPEVGIAGKKHPCKGCAVELQKGDKYYFIPNPRSPFSNGRRFCAACFKKVVAKTKVDLVSLESL